MKKAFSLVELSIVILIIGILYQINFSRALKNEERQAVENYLGKKWQIKLAR